MNTAPLRHGNKQAGYTLIQIIVVFLIIIVIIIAFGSQWLGFGDDARANVASNFLATSIPRSIVGFAQISGISSAATDSEIKDALVARGSKPMTPWGDEWTATIVDAPKGTGKYVRIKYPFAGSRPAETLADVRKRLDSPDYPLITNVQIVGGHTLQVDYNPPAGLRN